MVEANVRELNVWTGLSGLGALLLRGVSRNSTRSRKSCGLHVGMTKYAAKAGRGAVCQTLPGAPGRGADRIPSVSGIGYA